MDGRRLSATEAFELLMAEKHFEYRGHKDVFRTVVYVPRTNFSGDRMKKWHYFNYDNLAYWKVLKVSEVSRDLWAKK